MTPELNILARRIFNRLDKDIGDRRGLGNEWDQISPNIKNVEIRSAWEQIITEEIERYESGKNSEQPTKPNTTNTDLNRVTAWVSEISKHVNFQQVEIKRLTDRLNTIEGLGIPR